MELYADGPTLEEIDELNVDGYTFNPSLYKKLGASNYIDFSKKIANKIKNKSVSVEVIGDDEDECIRQGRIISKIAENIILRRNSKDH